MGRVIKLVITVLTILTIGFFVSTGNADPINVGDVIKLYDGPGTTGGGEFQVYKDGVGLFNTFCLERSEFFSFGQALTVAGISDRAIYGGTQPPPNGPGYDELDPRTAYLYTQFRAGTLSGYNTGDDASANALQLAIWYIEGEWTETLTGLALRFFKAADNSGWTDIGNVRVLNLVDSQGNRRQDQLVMVPEPSTLLLMGAGLIGIGVFGRKRFRRKGRN